MPIFEYSCVKCNHRFEKIVSASTVPECPSCGSKKLQRELSVFAVSTKGAGASTKSAPAGGCGTCGDPRGPGSCSTN